MKLNFFNVLTSGKSNASEVAEEIVRLEQALPEIKEALESRETVCMKMRQMKLGGGEFSQRDYDKAENAYHQAKLDLKAAEKSLEELQVKLQGLVEDRLDSDKKYLESERLRHKSEKSKWVEYYLKKMAEYHVAKVSLFGPVQAPMSGLHSWSAEETNIFNQEVNRIHKSSEEMPYSEEEKYLQKEQYNLSNQTVDGNITKFLEEAKRNLN